MKCDQDKWRLKKNTQLRVLHKNCVKKPASHSPSCHLSRFCLSLQISDNTFCFRALLSFGYFFLAIWGGVEVCAPDILLWNLIIVILNCTHTALLTWRFLPPTLTLDLTELYIKVSCWNN